MAEYADVHAELLRYANAEKAAFFPRFFKTGPGQYGEGDPAPTLHIAEMLLPDRHDLIQKAVGWMLRELGKRVDQNLLVDFLAKHHAQMGRTSLRYAIEHFPPEIRKQFLAGNFP